MSDKTFADYDRDTELYAESPEADFARFKVDFARMPIDRRIETLKVWDGLFQQESGPPTRDLSRRLVQMREITDIHRLLQRNGR